VQLKHSISYLSRFATVRWLLRTSSLCIIAPRVVATCVNLVAVVVHRVEIAAAGDADVVGWTELVDEVSHRHWALASPTRKHSQHVVVLTERQRAVARDRVCVAEARPSTCMHLDSGHIKHSYMFLSDRHILQQGSHRPQTPPRCCHV